MQSRCRFLSIAVVGLVGALPASLEAAPIDEGQQTEAALRGIVHHWDDAEANGDVHYLEQLLAPEYRSVDAKGGSHPRAGILEHARRGAGSAEERKAREAWMKAHPTEIAVVLHGDLGIVSYFNPQHGVDHSTRGSDVFVYEDHHWRAIYSLHNSAE
jgi:hypothetical protein